MANSPYEKGRIFFQSHEGKFINMKDTSDDHVIDMLNEVSEELKRRTNLVGPKSAETKKEVDEKLSAFIELLTK